MAGSGKATVVSPVKEAFALLLSYLGIMFRANPGLVITFAATVALLRYTPFGLEYPVGYLIGALCLQCLLATGLWIVRSVMLARDVSDFADSLRLTRPFTELARRMLVTLGFTIGFAIAQTPFSFGLALLTFAFSGLDNAVFRVVLSTAVLIFLVFAINVVCLSFADASQHNEFTDGMQSGFGLYNRVYWFAPLNPRYTPLALAGFALVILLFSLPEYFLAEPLPRGYEFLWLSLDVLRWLTLAVFSGLAYKQITQIRQQTLPA